MEPKKKLVARCGETEPYHGLVRRRMKRPPRGASKQPLSSSSLSASPHAPPHTAPPSGGVAADRRMQCHARTSLRAPSSARTIDRPETPSSSDGGGGGGGRGGHGQPRPRRPWPAAAACLWWSAFMRPKCQWKLGQPIKGPTKAHTNSPGCYPSCFAATIQLCLQIKSCRILCMIIEHNIIITNWHHHTIVIFAQRYICAKQ